MRRGKAFTLVEVLVVIAVIALLMAILMPALQRVKKMAKAIVCQSNLRQWGLWFPMYTSDNDERFFAMHHPHGHPWHEVMRPYYKDFNDVLLCPMAAKHKCESDRHYWQEHGGGKFSSWAVPVGASEPSGRYRYGSYGLNGSVRNDPNDYYYHGPYWKTTLVKSPANVPVFFDCQGSRSYAENADEPPLYDGEGASRSATNEEVCFNRHDGYVNFLFLDWTVRRVGLKELWTLKWHPDYDTANEWTTAGGVKPEDWPEWMRGFKDY